MKIEIDKKHNRYSFAIKKSDGKLLYASSKQFFLIPSIKSSYQYAWEAYRDAKRIPTYHLESLDKLASEEFVAPINTDVSAESMLEDHYNTILNGINDKARSVESDEDKEAIYEEIKMITSELLAIESNLEEEEGKEIDQIDDMIGFLKRITNRYFSDLLEKDKEEKEEADKAQAESDALMAEEGMGMEGMGGMEGGMGEPMPMDSPQNPLAMSSKRVLANDNFEKEVLEDFAEGACRAIQGFHPDAIYDIDIEHKEIKICDKEPILSLKVGEGMLLTNIMPNGKVYSIYPYHKSTFYQKYWKPIVESIGHIVVDNSMLLVPGKTVLPDFPSSPKSFTVNGWNIDNNKEENINVSFKGDTKDSIWLFEDAKSIRTSSSGHNVSKYTEQEYSNAIVKCINPQLKSIYGRTGAVDKILPGTNYVEVYVDFGRGLGTQIMSEQDIEIILSE